MKVCSFRLSLTPVPVKTLEQQQMTTPHRVRAGWMHTRVARINAVRGLLRELGYAIPVGARHVVPQTQALIVDAETEIPAVSREMFHDLCEEIRDLEARIGKVEREIDALARQNPVVVRLRTIPGVGVLTATALVAFVGDVERFASGRHFASYLGLTPREYSSRCLPAWREIALAREYGPEGGPRGRIRVLTRNRRRGCLSSREGASARTDSWSEG